MRTAALFALVPALLAAKASAGEMLSLEDKAFGADVILEARLPLDEPIPKKWPDQKYDPKGQGFPDALLASARKKATVERLLKSRSPDDKPALPEGLYVFSGNSPCWWKAHERKDVRTVLFFRQNPDGTLQQIAGVEQDSGLYSDLSPRYAALLAALEKASGWHEERMRAVAAEMLWPDERAALKSDEPYLMHLAAAFLRAHDSAAVLDEVWGAPGSEPRKQREKQATLPFDSVCKP
jgi:hypothetical protein